MIRLFDIVFSFIGIILLAPVFIVVAVWIKIDSAGTAFFQQDRVGKYDKDFKLFKFRTMRPEADKAGLLTVGGRDTRITRAGYFLRKYKIDELPQLFNVFFGEMSLVGPRPEVRRYVNYYTAEQKKILQVRPGITDEASIAYRNENEILSRSSDPESTYINEIMQDKIRLNMKFIENPTLHKYFQIIFRTIAGK